MDSLNLLKSINSPLDIKKLNLTELETLAAEIRRYIIEVCASNGGHLAPNLGVVELTLALHRVFDAPHDKLVFDVGHQAYVHKLLTGRRDIFPTLRQYKGLAGFPKREESEYDVFNTGHSSTSISAALGIATARDLAGENYNVVAVIGDGSMTGGMAYEAMNAAGYQRRRLIVVLNDNEMSISKNVGALSRYFYVLRTRDTYKSLKGDVEEWLHGTQHGEDVLELIDRVKKGVKGLMLPGAVFEHLGFKYFGPVDGNNVELVTELLESAKVENGPVLVHVVTKKGKGYLPAEEHPNEFHGTGPFEIATGKKIVKKDAPISYTNVFGKTIVELARDDSKIVAITAAMPDGTGLTSFAKNYPKRFFDVGIAEQHAVTFAAGLATEGIKPFVAIYSTFAQRAYDQILHDCCLQKLPVRFCLDRAGLVGDDGPTHHGVFDYAYLRSLPNMVAMAPKDENELRHMLFTMTCYKAGPIAVRYPRGSGLGVEVTEPMHIIPIGKSEFLRSGTDICIWAIGSMVQVAREAAARLGGAGLSVGVVNARFVKPLDVEMLAQTAEKYKYLVTLEEGVLEGGFGSAVLETLESLKLLGDVKVMRLGIPDEFVPHGDRKLLLRDLGLLPEQIAERIEKEFRLLS